jgi:hypothetical protein
MSGDFETPGPDDLALAALAAVRYQPGEPGACQYPGCPRPAVAAKWNLWCDDPDHAPCTFPGCLNTVKPRAEGQGKPFRYCFQTTPNSLGTLVEHNREASFQERNRLNRGPRRDAAGITDPTAGPYSAAVAGAEVVVEDVVRVHAQLVSLVNRLEATFGRLADPGTAAAEIAAIRAEADEKVARANLAATTAETRARAAEALQDEANEVAVEAEAELDQLRQERDAALTLVTETEVAANDHLQVSQAAQQEAAEAREALIAAQQERDQANAGRQRAVDDSAQAAKAMQAALADRDRAIQAALEARQIAEQATAAQAAAELDRDEAAAARADAADRQRAAEQTAARAEERADQAAAQRDAAVAARDAALNDAADLREQLTTAHRELAVNTATITAAQQALDRAETAAGQASDRAAAAEAARTSAYHQLTAANNRIIEIEGRLASATAELTATTRGREEDQRRAEQHHAELRTLYDADLAAAARGREEDQRRAEQHHAELRAAYDAQVADLRRQLADARHPDDGAQPPTERQQPRRR